jgi:methionine salvage enolase-phosphatase E1
MANNKGKNGKTTVKDYVEKNKQEELLKEMQKEKEERAKLCTEELNELLKKHNCKIVVQMVWNEGFAPAFLKTIEAI